MKTIVHISSVVLFLVLLFLTVQSCQNSKTEVYPISHQMGQVDTVWHDTLSETIPLEELPVTIKEEINKDELFQGLNISNITKITDKDVTYYDMTFKDADGQLIMVFYDEGGKIIVP